MSTRKTHTMKIGTRTGSHYVEHKIKRFRFPHIEVWRDHGITVATPIGPRELGNVLLIGNIGHYKWSFSKDNNGYPWLTIQSMVTGTYLENENAPAYVLAHIALVTSRTWQVWEDSPVRGWV